MIWRRVLVPSEITFKRLHDIIQVSMGWGNVHLYDFNIIEDKLRITGDEEVIEEYGMYSKIKYIYDFGYYWKYDLILEEIVENYEGNNPVCIDGDGAYPPDDVGGILEYMEFLAIMNDKNHPEYDETKKWAEYQNYKDTFDIKKINSHMVELYKKKI